MVSCILFDLDGTLIDSKQDLANSINHVRMFNNLLPLDLETVVGYIGNGVHELVKRSFAGTTVDLNLAIGEMKKYYLAHLTENTRCYPGVKTGLDELSKAGFPIAVVTNKLEKPARQLLSALDILKYIDLVIGGDSGLPLKPDPAPILSALHQFNGDKNSSWMVGDHNTDLECARRAGIKSAYAAYGFGNPGKEKFTIKIDCFAEFVTKIILDEHQKI